MNENMRHGITGITEICPRKQCRTSFCSYARPAQHGPNNCNSWLLALL